MAKPRGCGERIAGGIYASVGLSPFGSPVEKFLVDPPLPITDLPITPVGVKLLRNAKSGRVHAFDWVGSEHYPNVADFVEEVKRMGLSRRLPKNLDFTALTAESRIMLIHARAIIQNFADYYETGESMTCPKNLPDHTWKAGYAIKETCVGLYWKDLDPETVKETVPSGMLRVADEPAWRTMPSFSYHGRQRPDGVHPTYQPGIFMAMGVQKLEVVRDKLKGTHELSETLAAQSKLPVVLVDE